MENARNAEHAVALSKSSMSADQSADSIPQADSIRLFLCDDVMTGGGIDQVLPHPNDPRLHEPCIGEARSYVELAESVNGAIPRPVEFDYIWGVARGGGGKNPPGFGEQALRGGGGGRTK